MPPGTRRSRWRPSGAVPSSADCSSAGLRRTSAIAAVLLLAGVSGCSQGASSGTPDREPTTAGASASTSPAADPTPPVVRPGELADQLAGTLTAARGAVVHVDVGTAFAFDGTARFGPGSWSLDGHVDFRDSDVDSDYAVDDLAITVQVPPGVDFPSSTRATRVNQWGPALSRIDPGVVVAATRTYGREVTVSLPGNGKTAYNVTLDGPRALDAFGYDPSPQMPETISYSIVVDPQGRPLVIHASFDDYGNDVLSFEDWT